MINVESIDNDVIINALIITCKFVSTNLITYKENRKRSSCA